MLIRLKLAVAAATLALAPVPASAATYLFTLSSGLSGSWKLPASPVPDFVDANSFRITNVTGVFADVPFTGTLHFFEAVEGGGVCGVLLDDCNLFDLYGPQLFTGTIFAPTFQLGSYPMTTRGLEPLGTLTISVVPEAATWAMMIAGFGLVGAGLRRRRRALATA